MAAPDPERLAVWRSLVTSNLVLNRALTSALEEERGISLAWFEALNALQLAGGRMRVMDLAEHLVASPSSLSRQLSRMEDEGYVRRERGHRDDGRAVVTVLTPEGRAVWRRASTTYWRTAKRLFINRLSESDVAALQRALNKVLDG